MKRLLVLCILVVAPAAHGDVWQHAIDPDPHFDVYEALLNKGDEAAISANVQSISLSQMRKELEIAVEAYHAAAKANPTAAEPYFRIASVLYSFFFDCDSVGGFVTPPKTCLIRGPTHDEKARETVEAWDKFESLAPLDPRVNEILLQRAIMRTKLVSTSSQPRPLLEGAAKDYRALLDREDGLLFGSNLGRVLILGNLAETQMMLGNLDDAIDTYVAAKRYGARSSTLYGLAVALDRDDRQSEAMAIIRSLGIDAYIEFQREFETGQVFFVPSGEEEYYFALCDETFGRLDLAVEHWKAFVVSGAHPKYQPRAKEHLDRLLSRKKLRWRVPLVPDLERDGLTLRRRPRITTPRIAPRITPPPPPITFDPDPDLDDPDADPATAPPSRKKKSRK